jgi:hypothetical protein
VVDRRASFEVRERILADGSVFTPLDLADSKRSLVPALAQGGFRAIAVCLPNAYVNPAHEEALKALDRNSCVVWRKGTGQTELGDLLGEVCGLLQIRRCLPEVHVTLSFDITREFREEFDHFQLLGYGLIPDSCGHSRHRGGLGLWRRFEILKDVMNFAIYADRLRLAPYCLLGGTDGTRARCQVEREGRIIAVRSKDGLELRRGDMLTLYTAGGGGYGPPEERSGPAITADIAQGFVSEAEARRAYGRTD